MVYVVQRDKESERWVVRVFLDETQTQYGATVFCRDEEEANKALQLLTGDTTLVINDFADKKSA